MFKNYQKFCIKHKVLPEIDDGVDEGSDSVETDVMENLTTNVSQHRYQKKFYNDHSATFKTELLQTVKLFEHHLSGDDPFYIESESLEPQAAEILKK